MGNDRIDISVLMLTYNFEKYIDEAIRGVMHQRCSHNFELVIGDDHSTDGTVEICRRWAAKYPGHIVLMENVQNRGLMQNFADTYAHCRGRYIAICEGDDYWIDRTKLQRQADFLDAHPDYAMCVHRVVNYYEEDGSMSLSNGGQKSDNDIIDLARRNFVTNVSVMFRHANVNPLPEWVTQAATYDYAMHMLNAEHGNIRYMNRCMAVYRKRREALWSRAGAEKQYRMAMQVRKMLMSHFSDSSRADVCELLRKAYIDNAVALVRHYLATGQKEQADAVAQEAAAAAGGIDAQEIAKLAKTPAPRPRLAQLIARRIIAPLRRQVSRLLPVPHAR